MIVLEILWFRKWIRTLVFNLIDIFSKSRFKQDSDEQASTFGALRVTALFPTSSPWPRAWATGSPLPPLSQLLRWLRPCRGVHWMILLRHIVFLFHEKAELNIFWKMWSFWLRYNATLMLITFIVLLLYVQFIILFRYSWKVKGSCHCFRAGLGNVGPTGHMRPARHLNVAREHFLKVWWNF